MIEAVGVVIPVHDEGEHLPACLAALDDAFAGLACDEVRGRPVPLAVVVLDACTDESEGIARRWAREGAKTIVAVDCRNVGRARAAGMSRVLEMFASRDPAHIWLATTDADSLVPRDWLRDQIRIAADGVDACAGSIRVRDWTGHPPGTAERFNRFYEPPGSDDSHGHVHGANLGVRADAYIAAGGFEPLPSGEDHALWRALKRAMRKSVSSRSFAVTTSARLRGRAPAGFSGFLGAFPAPR